MKEGGATPKKDPTQKGKRGTPITGETMLMNQLGKNGVMRRKRMYERRLDLEQRKIKLMQLRSREPYLWLSTLADHCAALSGRQCHTSFLPTR